MLKTGIVADSHSSISQKEAARLGIKVLPAPFFIDGECYLEDVTLSREDFFRKLENGSKIHTSQPSPESVMNSWDEALTEYEEILYFPISSGLSGSCMTCMMLAAEEKYDGRVFVVDNGRVSTPMHVTILDALEMIDEGFGAESIKKALEASRNDEVIYLAVDTLKYLYAGGRISRTSAVLGTVLNIKPILYLNTGLLDLYKNCRGFTKAKKTMINCVKKDIETRFKEEYEKGQIYLMAATSADPVATEEWKKEIEASFPGQQVYSDYLSLGVCCHTGAGALGIGISVKTPRPV